MPSLMFEGAPSTNSLASFNPKPVSSLTALITLIFSPPAAFNTTVNSVCSSSAAPPAAPPATATGAAADTPNSSSQALTNSFNSHSFYSFDYLILIHFIISFFFIYNLKFFLLIIQLLHLRLPGMYEQPLIQVTECFP